ncbi:MAG: hypothetical protein V2B13_07460 [Pseudomonadota bacterium]
MNNKEDIILECFVLKGKGMDWLAFIYLEEGTRLKAFLRFKLTEKLFQVTHLVGPSQKDLSEELHVRFNEVSKPWGLSTVHLEYPEGVKEKAFIQGLREAKLERRMTLEGQKN